MSETRAYCHTHQRFHSEFIARPSGFRCIGCRECAREDFALMDDFPPRPEPREDGFRRAERTDGVA